MGIDRGCPWTTAADRCLGHVGGTAGEDDSSQPGGEGHRLGRRVRPVLGDHLPRGKPPEAAPQPQGGALDRYPVPMSDEESRPEVPRHHRYDYGGLCWWCGAPADSKEHKYKKTDLTRIFGSGPYIGDAAVVRGVAGMSRQVQGPKSNELKFGPVLCATCNNARSQRFDLAYDRFVKFASQHEEQILRTRTFRFSDVYGATWRIAKEELAKYYVKHIGCRLADAGIKVEQPVLDYLDGRSRHLSGLQLRFGIHGGILALDEHLRTHGDSFGGGLWMGDVTCMYSPSTGLISQVEGDLGYRWLWLYYIYDSRIIRDRGSFRRNKVKLAFSVPMDLAAVERECGQCRNGS
jgi:hypothetical protein